MSVGIGRRRMNPVRAVQFLATPPTAGAQEIVGIQRLTALENDEAATGHLGFKCFDNCGRGRGVGRQVDIMHLGPDGIDREDPASGLFDCVDV